MRKQAISPQEYSEIREQPNRTIDTREKIEPEMLSQVHPTRFPASTVAPAVSSPHSSQSELFKSDHVTSLCQLPSLLLTEHTSHSPSATLPQPAFAQAIPSAYSASPLDIHVVIPSNLLNCYPQRPTLTILFKTAAIPTPFILFYLSHSTYFLLGFLFIVCLLC